MSEVEILLERLRQWELLAIELLKRCPQPKPPKPEKPWYLLKMRRDAPPPTVEVCAKISQTLTGRGHSEERKQRIREGMAASAKWQVAKQRSRPPITEKTRHRLQQAHLGRPHTQERKRKISLTLRRRFAEQARQQPDEEQAP